MVKVKKQTSLFLDDMPISIFFMLFFFPGIPPLDKSFFLQPLAAPLAWATLSSSRSSSNTSLPSSTYPLPSNVINIVRAGYKYNLVL